MGQAVGLEEGRQTHIAATPEPQDVPTFRVET
jgi:hypothetical protein